MEKGNFVQLLLFAGISALSHQALGDPLVDRAEAFRAELAARNMIVGRDPELGSARAIAQIPRDYIFDLFEFERCGTRGIKDTPDRIESDSINTFAGSFREKGDRPCDGFKDGAACQYLQNNCITLGNAIFCDYDYLDFKRQLARASFSYAHMELALTPDARAETVRFNPFSFELLADFAAYQAGERESSQRTQDLPPSVAGAIGYSHKNKSMLSDSAENIVFGAVIGHEFAHMESNVCPIDHSYAESPGVVTQEVMRRAAAELGIRVYSKDEAEETARKYIDMTCHETLSQAELAADIRGIAMSSTVLLLQYRLWELGYGHSHVDRATTELFRIKPGVAVVALAQALEYQLIVSADPREGAARVKGEPWAMNKKYVYDNESMYEYYRSLAYERTKGEFASGNPTRGLRHMYPAYRAGLLLQTAGLPALYDQRRKLGFKVSFPIRLYGYLHGSLQAVQEFSCSRDSDSADKRAQEFLREISGIRDDEYLVD